MTTSNHFHADEQKLLIQLAEGNEDAFNTLFKRYRNQLFTYLYKITRSRENAEEIVLDVFLKIWTARNIALEIKNFEAFLFKVAYYKALDFLRSVQNKPEMQEEIETALGLISDKSPDEHILRQDMKKKIKSAISRLSPQRQQVFRLSREEGLSYEEIAQRLQLSRNTVRNHLSASLAFIRRFINMEMLFAGYWLLVARCWFSFCHFTA